MPEALANALRATVLSSLKVEFRGRAGVALYLFSDARCVYNFGADAARLHLNGAALEVPRTWLALVRISLRPLGAGAGKDNSFRRTGSVEPFHPDVLVANRAFRIMPLQGERAFAELPLEILARLRAHRLRPEIREVLNDISISAQGSRLPLAKSFASVDHISLIIQETGETDAIGYRFIDLEPYGTMIQLFDGSGTPVAGLVDASVIGVPLLA